jgi:hypothetical protein
MMTSDEKTLIPSLINYINSDLFTLENISSEVTLEVQKYDKNEQDEVELFSKEWGVIISYLPLKFYRIIESYPDIYTYEEFDKKYTRNPKMCAYERYGSTNMWRPLMILNRCPTITRFDFQFIKYFNITTFTSVLSVLISRVRNNES